MGIGENYPKVRPNFQVYERFWNSYAQPDVLESFKPPFKGPQCQVQLDLESAIFAKEIPSRFALRKPMASSYLAGGLEHEFYFSIQLGMSSSQLTNSLHHFSEG